MQSEQEHSENVKAGHEIILKAVNHHRVNIVAVERVDFEKKETRVGHPDREMREVIEDKSEHDEPAQRHGTRRESRLDVLFLFVADRTRPAIFESETVREKNM